jgi:hypothetical protein
MWLKCSGVNERDKWLAGGMDIDNDDSDAAVEVQPQLGLYGGGDAQSTERCCAS